MTTDALNLPMPPIELRRLVGPTDPAAFDNPTGRGALEAYRGKRQIHFTDIFKGFGKQKDFDYTSVLDFGCGCGRIARQMIQQRQRPSKYLGLDLNLEAIDWCKNNLEPSAPGFAFEHLNFNNLQFNPEGSYDPQGFPVVDDLFTLAIAISVFTHIVEANVRFYLRECARVRAPGDCDHLFQLIATRRSD